MVALTQADGVQPDLARMDCFVLCAPKQRPGRWDGPLETPRRHNATARIAHFHCWPFLAAQCGQNLPQRCLNLLPLYWWLWGCR